MHPFRRSLLLMIAFGGTAVLGSYVLALVGEPSLQSGLWGGLPESLKGMYTVNMFLAAGAFFPATLSPFLFSSSNPFPDHIH